MDLQQLYEKHDQQKENYSGLRDKIWQDMKQRHENITAAFQSKKNLPEGYSEKMDKEVDAFNSEWSIPDGTKYKNMILKQEQEISEIVSDLQPANDQKELETFVDRFASSKILEEEAEKDVTVGKQFSKNKDDMDLEID